MRKRPLINGQTMILRGASGFGDAILIIYIVTEFLKKHTRISLRTKHPSLFTHLGIATERFRKGGEHVAFNYGSRKKIKETNQFQDMCISAGIPSDRPFNIKWPLHNKRLVVKVREMAAGKPICIVGNPHTPFGRRDGYGLELRPKWSIFDEVIEKLKGEMFFVQIGKGNDEYRFKGIDYDLRNKVSDTDSMDLAQRCDCLMGQNGYIIPLAECFDKPLFLVYSKRGLESKDPYISNTSPQKILSKPTSQWVVDDWNMGIIHKKARQCFSQILSA